ncbi:MAG: hypothetical protein AAFX87_18805 [Bacteroidota bacterium]
MYNNRKNGLKATFAVVLFSLCLTTFSKAQQFESPVDYMQFISEQHLAISQDMMSYTSAAAHSKRAKKIDRKRQELLKTSLSARNKISKMPGYEGDKSYRDAVVEYLKISYSVLNEDYAKIVDMEEIAEQSYDNMEAYLLAQERASEKLNEASITLDKHKEEFADQHNIRLVQNETKLSAKIEEANKVIKYYNQVYLIFFKSYKDESYLLDAVKAKDLNALEQSKNTMLKNAGEGVSKVNQVKVINDDHSLRLAAQNMLKFYKSEAEQGATKITNYMLTKENFETVKSNFEKIKQSKRTQADVDKYNKAVQDFNKAVEDYNANNEELNKNRSKLLAAWNKAADKFMDNNVPKYK